MSLQTTTSLHLILCAFAETRLLKPEDSKNYAIEGFKKICKNDQTWNSRGRPPHGLIAYVKDAHNMLEEYSHKSKF